MQIVFHVGAHHTNEERLLKSLLKNTETFSKQGVKVPGPGKYRRLLWETMSNLQGSDPAPDTRDILVDAILDDEQANRLILSHGGFLSAAEWIFRTRSMYGQAPQRLQTLRKIFPEDELEIFLALRNPATFLPSIYAGLKDREFDDFMNGVDPMKIAWSHLVSQIQTQLPDVPITVWCNEDTPLIWAQLIREISGVDPLTKIIGGFDLISSIMAPEGMKRFLVYLKSHPPQTEIQKRRIIAAFLDKYAIAEELEQELDIPGWDGDYVDELTARYEEDVYKIERMPGISFIAP